MSVELVHWNPVRPVLPGRVGRWVPWRRAVNNFGVLLGPMLIGAILSSLGLDAQRSTGTGRLLTVGSVMHFAEPGDVVWGSGINGKQRHIETAATLDVRAVRGPRTRELLLAGGASVPEVYGDPGLLWSRFWPREHYLRRGVVAVPSGVTIVPNLHDWPSWRNDPRAVSPQAPVHDVIARIAASEMVVGSSLHGVVLADSFGIPARLIAATREPPFKYDDYLSGSGRAPYAAAETLDQALALGPHPPPVWDPEPLLAAFPRELFEDS